MQQNEKILPLLPIAALAPRVRWESLLALYESKPQPQWESLFRAIRKYPDAPWQDALCRGQIASKLWLIDRLATIAPRELETIFILGGWLGILPFFLSLSGITFRKMRAFDIDPQCAPIADAANCTLVMDNWKFKASTADMCQLDYYETKYETLRADGSLCKLQDKPDIIINTVCEHLDSFPAWLERIPRGTLLVLQSNNFRSPAHHQNICESLEDFQAQVKLGQTAFAGKLELGSYDRWMLMGWR